MYDEPEFVIRNIWRLWRLVGWQTATQPASDVALANVVAEMAGGPSNLARRARQLADAAFRVACHLIDMASDSEPASPEFMNSSVHLPDDGLMSCH